MAMLGLSHTLTLFLAETPIIVSLTQMSPLPLNRSLNPRSAALRMVIAFSSCCGGR